MMRDSLAVIRAWVPTWKPRHRRRAAIVIFGLGAALMILAWTAPGSVRNAYTRVRNSVAALPGLAWLDRDKPKATALRPGESSMPSGILYLSPQFHSSDGSYDLVFFFHGNVGLVEDSFNLAGINAVEVIMNIGNGTSAYDQYFSSTATLPALLARVDEELVQRGLAHPHLGRVALTAWSAGYGAVARILESGVLGDSVDAIILLDGFHSSFDASHHVELTRLAPFAAFAERAMRDERLLTITHSEVETYTYPTTRETSDALLAMLHLDRMKSLGTVEWPALSQDHGVRRDKIPPLEPTTECQVGSFRVRGYSGGTREHHMAHLIYMASIALPDLERRWRPAIGATFSTH